MKCSPDGRALKGGGAAMAVDTGDVGEVTAIVGIGASERAADVLAASACSL